MLAVPPGLLPSSHIWNTYLILDNGVSTSIPVPNGGEACFPKCILVYPGGGGSLASCHTVGAGWSSSHPPALKYCMSRATGVLGVRSPITESPPTLISPARVLPNPSHGMECARTGYGDLDCMLWASGAGRDVSAARVESRFGTFPSATMVRWEGGRPRRRLAGSRRCRQTRWIPILLYSVRPRVWIVCIVPRYPVHT